MALKLPALINRETVGPSARLPQPSRKLTPNIDVHAEDSGATLLEQQISPWERMEPEVTPEQVNAASREAARTFENIESLPDFLSLMTPTDGPHLIEWGLGENLVL
jgi:hypothetical protein